MTKHMDEEIQDDGALSLDDDFIEVEKEDFEEDGEQSNEELERLQRIAQNQKIRAEKAEKELKALRDKKPTEKKETKDSNLSLKDIRALSNVHDDDVDDIMDYAKWKGLTIAEAKESAAMKAVIKSKEEERRTALATNTGAGKRGTSTISDERILQDIESGKLPEKDEDFEKLANARFNQRKNRK